MKPMLGEVKVVISAGDQGVKVVVTDDILGNILGNVSGEVVLCSGDTYALTVHDVAAYNKLDTTPKWITKARKRGNKMKQFYKALKKSTGN